MSDGGKQKKIYKVANEFNASTQSIVDTLKVAGYTISNRPNENVSEEMMSALDASYAADKAKNLEHERHREEYELRRQQSAPKRNDMLGIEDLLTPIDS